jgi:hypothetical protein
MVGYLHFPRRRRTGASISDPCRPSHEELDILRCALLDPDAANVVSDAITELKGDGRVFRADGASLFTDNASLGHV